MSDRGGGLIGEIMEQGGSIVKQTAKTVVKTPVAIVGGVGSQVTGAGGVNDADQPSAENLSNNPSDQKPVPQTHSSKNQPVPRNATEKSSEEIKKIEELRKQLHSQYYQTLVNPKRQEEEKPAEKVEREKQEERMELSKNQEEEKKKEPIPVVRAKNKAEKFRGVSG